MLSVPLCISETLLDATHSTLSIFVLLKVMSSYNSNDFAFDCDLLPQFSDSGMSDSIPDEDRALLESSDESTGGSLSSTSFPPSSITSVPDSLDSATSGGSLSSSSSLPSSITSVPDSLDSATSGGSLSSSSSPPLRLPACQIRWIPLRQGDRCPQRRRLPPCQIRWTPAMMRSWRKTTRGSVRQPFDSRCPVSQSFALLRMTLPSSRWRSRHRVSPLLTLLPLRALLRALHSDDAYDSIINMQLQCMRGTPTWCRCAPGGPAVRNSLHPQAGDEDSRYSNRKGHLHPGQGRIRRGRASRAPTHQPRGVRGA